MAKKKGIIETVTEGFAESTRNVHQINKEHFAAVKADARKNNPEFDEFLHTKGIGNKARLAVENMKESAADAAEQEREHRAEIQSHESYRTMLKKQREAQQKTINHMGKF